MQTTDYQNHNRYLTFCNRWFMELCKLYQVKLFKIELELHRKECMAWFMSPQEAEPVMMRRLKTIPEYIKSLYPNFYDPEVAIASWTNFLESRVSWDHRIEFSMDGSKTAEYYQHVRCFIKKDYKIPESSKYPLSDSLSVAEHIAQGIRTTYMLGDATKTRLRITDELLSDLHLSLQLEVGDDTWPQGLEITTFKEHEDE